jgi:hypothetical protein
LHSSQLEIRFCFANAVRVHPYSFVFELIYGRASYDKKGSGQPAMNRSKQAGMAILSKQLLFYWSA